MQPPAPSLGVEGNEKFHHDKTFCFSIADHSSVVMDPLKWHCIEYQAMTNSKVSMRISDLGNLDAKSSNILHAFLYISK